MQLTHLPLDNMAAISQAAFSNASSWMKNFVISIQIPLKFVPKDPIDNKSALVQIMAWCRPGNKPLPEPMLTQFADNYMWHWRRWVKGKPNGGSDYIQKDEKGKAITPTAWLSKKAVRWTAYNIRSADQAVNKTTCRNEITQGRLRIMWCDFTEYWYLHLNSKHK